jgi:hypothetical protein
MVKWLAVLTCASALLACAAGCGGSGTTGSSTSVGGSTTSPSQEDRSSPTKQARPKSAVDASPGHADRPEPAGSGKSGDKQGMRHPAEEKPVSKNKVGRAVEGLLGDLGAGKKHGSRHRSNKLQKLLAQARKEGVHVVKPDDAGSDGVSGGVDQILDQLKR